MKEKIKKYLLFIRILGGLLLLIIPAFVYSGDAVFYFPSYDYSTTSTCPFLSYYDTISRTCKCNSGYIASGGTCVLASFYCQELFGINAQYNSITNSCECRYGYILSGNKCVSQNTYCHEKYGYNSSYNILSRNCECDSGYKLVQTGLLQQRCVKSEPVISRFYPITVRMGETVTVYGSNFGNSTGDIMLNTSGYFFGISDRISTLNIKYWNDTQISFIVPKDKKTDDYYIGIKPRLASISDKEGVSITRLKVLMPLPKISGVSSLKVKSGESVTIRGENLGTDKRGDLKLYIGFSVVNPFNITSWRDDKIIFNITDDLESGYVILKDNKLFDPTTIKGPFLEITKLKETQTFSSFPLPSSKIQDTPEPQSEPIQKTQPIYQEEPQSSEEFQLEPQSLVEELLPRTEESEEEEQQKEDDIVINDQQEQIEETAEEKPQQSFIVRAFSAIRTFFSRLFRR